MAPQEDMDTGKLTPRQDRFVQEYLKDLNATQAAIRAGYSTKNAGKIASQLLGKTRVADAIADGKARAAEKAGVSVDYVINGLRTVAERCLQGEPVLAKGSDGELVETGEWRFDSAGANRAFELLGKHVGAFEKDNNQKKPNVTVHMEF